MIDWIVPDWPSPENVSAIFTTRNKGMGRDTGRVYAGLNLANHVGDDPQAVQQNRICLRRYLPGDPCWLIQVHGTRPVWVDTEGMIPPEGDAAMSRRHGIVCAVLVADCLPVLLCDAAGSVVGIAHAGWRGLVGGIIENTVEELRRFSRSDQLIAWLGPAIGPQYFEVGDEVRIMFLKHGDQAECAFSPGKEKGKWYANIFDLARQRLSCAGIDQVYGGDICTFNDPTRFYSYRRDGITGRMAGLVWMTQPPK